MHKSSASAFKSINHTTVKKPPPEQVTKYPLDIFENKNIKFEEDSTLD